MDSSPRAHGIDDDASWELIDSDSGEVDGNTDALWVDIGADLGTIKQPL